MSVCSQNVSGCWVDRAWIVCTSRTSLPHSSNYYFCEPFSVAVKFVFVCIRLECFVLFFIFFLRWERFSLEITVQTILSFGLKTNTPLLPFTRVLRVVRTLLHICLDISLCEKHDHNLHQNDERQRRKKWCSKVELRFFGFCLRNDWTTTDHHS